jgi:hypothetical protein
MALTPDPPFPKQRGHSIRSKDWNDAVNEVMRLDNAKVNRAGDTLAGPITAAGDTSQPQVNSTGVTGTGKIGVAGRGAADQQFAGVGVRGRGTTGIWGHGQGATHGGATYEGFGVYGRGDDYGVFGESSGYGVFGYGHEFGVYGQSSGNAGSFAGFFRGNVHVTGTLEVDGILGVDGRIEKRGGGFKIDHPLDPAHRYLSHSFVESPDMMNIYNGNVTTNDDCEAVVALPGYFEALNRDFRYQLTVIGQFAQAIIAREIEDNRFTIKTDKPRVTVSWQVTGIRRDSWADAHRIPVEEDKTDAECNRYLRPGLYGYDESRSVAPAGP